MLRRIAVARADLSTRRAAALACTALMVACAAPARADTPGPTAATTTKDDDGWDREKTRLRTIDFVLVPALGAAMLTTGLAAQGSVEPAWTGRNTFDDGVRDALRGGTERTRRTARVASDTLWIGLTLYPAAIDALLLAGIVHKKSAIAFDLFMIWGESALSAGVLTVLTDGLVFRGRPLVDRCASDASYDPMCGTRQQSRSFFAGHVAASFNSAALTCLNGVELPLYGSRGATIAACAGTMALATTTGVLRIVGDKHWASDVLAGAGVGAATGFLVPWFLHYGRARSTSSATSWVITPILTGETRGLSFYAPL